jgi:EpsI family protein
VTRTRECWIAILILLVAGLGIRSLSHGEATPLRLNLHTLPSQIGSWVGIEQVLEPHILQLLKVDDYLMRQYVGAPADPPIGLYVGYYQSMRQGATYHSPKNCLPGGGWSFVHTGKLHLQGIEGQEQPVEVNQFVIQKGLDKQLVLYWYQDRGRIITSEYWARLYMVFDAITRHRTDGAFVRIMVPMVPTAEDATYAQGKAFAEQLLPILQAHLPG